LSVSFLEIGKGRIVFSLQFIQNLFLRDLKGNNPFPIFQLKITECHFYLP
jgi:hypothetical protein